MVTAHLLATASASAAAAIFLTSDSVSACLDRIAQLPQFKKGWIVRQVFYLRMSVCIPINLIGLALTLRAASLTFALGFLPKVHNCLIYKIFIIPYRCAKQR
jgi:sterol desaturase/sphingolipid hydroxylase (fatty acid hydroxylase superfamily)